MAIQREWHNLASAAERLVCSEDDVLHLAATNRLRVCIFVSQRVTADWCEVEGSLLKLPPKLWDIPIHDHFVGLTAPTAQHLATHSRAEVASFDDLRYPNHAFRLHKLRGTDEQPRILVRRSEVQVHEADIVEYQSRFPANQGPVSKRIQDEAFDAAAAAIPIDIHNLPPPTGRAGVPVQLWTWFQGTKWNTLWESKDQMDYAWREYLVRKLVKTKREPTSRGDLQTKKGGRKVPRM